MTPEQRARRNIDNMLEASGWHIQNYATHDTGAALDAGIDVLKAEIRRAERLQQSILKHAFSGKLVPQDPSDEPASVLLEKVRKEKEDRQPKRRKQTTKLKTQDSDGYPLLALAGALEHRDNSIGDASLGELSGDKSE